MSFFILQEDGASKILLEDGSSALLLDPVTGLDQFYWPPVFPDRIPPLRITHSKHWEEGAAVFVPKTIPIPDILSTRGWLPAYPDRIPPRLILRELIEPTSGALTTTTALVPSAWFPSYPDRAVPRQATPLRQGQVDATPPFQGVVASVQLGWLPRFPDQIRSHRSLGPSGSVGSLGPSDIAYQSALSILGGSVSCLTWVDRRLTPTDLLTEIGSASMLLRLKLTRTDLIAEALC